MRSQKDAGTTTYELYDNKITSEWCLNAQIVKTESGEQTYLRFLQYSGREMFYIESRPLVVLVNWKNLAGMPKGQIHSLNQSPKDHNSQTHIFP